MSQYIIIDGVEYPVHMYDFERNADILDRYAYRNENGVLLRKVIGTYYNYSFHIFTQDRTIYNTLFDVLSEPVEYHTVELPTDHVSFKAYFSSVSDSLDYIDEDGCKWKNLSAKLTASIPARRG